MLGYEVLNEPWAGNIYQDLSLLLPGVAGSRNLEPVKQNLSTLVVLRFTNLTAFLFSSSFHVYYFKINLSSSQYVLIDLTECTFFSMLLSVEIFN